MLGSRGAFSRLFEGGSCRFEISIRRPEAHFAWRERRQLFRCSPMDSAGVLSAGRPADAQWDPTRRRFAGIGRKQLQ
jgi:hypothetical protein